MALFSSQTETENLQPPVPGEARKIFPEREELSLLHEPHGPIAEQYRGLRNSIQSLNPDGAPRSVMMTSSVRGEGKTVGCLNLAMALCELPRMKVLVVDADLHNSSMEGLLGLPRRQGITELMRGKLHLDQAIRQTAIEGLSIVGRGSKPDKSSQVLGADRVRTVLHAFKQRFDYVLIDTAPALAINDASLLGALMDGILLFVRLGETPRHYVEQTAHLLENLGGNILGSCLVGAGDQASS